MTPQKQLYLHDPENGVWGDCQRAAIASILDRPVEDVPHFFFDGCDGDTADKRIDDWLSMLNLKMIFVPFEGSELQNILNLQAMFQPGIHYMLVGKSRTGVNHCVVCKDSEIVHDPSLTDAGIVGPTDEGLFWIQYLGVRV
ncbi:MAG: hypothetical protein KDK08_05130 [Rhizobiaceae bacterium]|mgnify:CR=1 FL=1|nr:hypothetical protein [Rhizobiaceae bacterium]MCC0000852.1 hypothetical protein [Methylobacteriaceae bacterium]HRW61546.1 hypothetical protein [Defluviicoccus sp.]